ncbi:MAG: hypothetical protein Q4B60_09240 [Erysipelotrichaceae bacterium]|nr:hypothetical protein [Erysipelotrichaceae bacterium]
MNKNTIPEDFTLALALVDGLPVIFFAINMIIIGIKFKSFLFVFGALLCTFAGLAKVFWKIIVALKKKNIWFLFIQMRITMPLGFLIILLSLIFNYKRINLSVVLRFPACVFFLIGIIGMCLMGYFALKLDNSDLKSNWIEQITNTFAQLALLIGTLLV